VFFISKSFPLLVAAPTADWTGGGSKKFEKGLLFYFTILLTDVWTVTTSDLLVTDGNGLTY
jgi:hypothetical protein